MVQMSASSSSTNVGSCMNQNDKGLTFKTNVAKQGDDKLEQRPRNKEDKED